MWQLNTMFAVRSTVASLLLSTIWHHVAFAQGPQAGDPTWLSPAVKAVDTEVQKLRQGFIVYEDVDSGYNHGTFSGFFGSPSAVAKISIDTGCVPSGNPPTGCSSDVNAVDKD